MQGHAHLETARREPWLFGEPTTTRIRDAIRARYAMLPYIYTLFRHANLTGKPPLMHSVNTLQTIAATRADHLILWQHCTQQHLAAVGQAVGNRRAEACSTTPRAGQPVMRPVWFEFPEAEAAFGLQDQFMLGPAVLAAPVLQEGATQREVLLPQQATWFDAATGARVCCPAPGMQHRVCSHHR